MIFLLTEVLQLFTLVALMTSHIIEVKDPENESGRYFPKSQFNINTY